MSEDEIGAEDHCVDFVRTWAEAVLRQVERVRTMRRKFAQDQRARELMTAHEQMAGLRPTEDDQEKNWRSLWAEEHILVWAAHQLEEWSRRLATMRGEEPSEPDKLLADLRNTLEHLHEVEFEGSCAVVPPNAPSKRHWSLRRLPHGRLVIGAGGRRAFNLIEPETLEERALAVVRKIDAEMDELIEAAGEHYMEMLADAERERRALDRAGILWED